MKTLQDSISELRQVIREAKEQIARLQTPDTKAIAEIVAKFREINKGAFVGVTYASKSTGSICRYTLQVGVSYLRLCEESKTELEIYAQKNPGIETAQTLEGQAFRNVRDSVLESIAAQKEGREHSAYTKSGMYAAIAPGIRLNTNDFTLEISAKKHVIRVISPGVKKVVNSRPLTLAQNKLRDMLPISKWITLAIDVDALASIRIAGSEIELESALV